MDNGLLQALMMGMAGGGGGMPGAGAVGGQLPAGAASSGNPLAIGGGMSPQLMQFAQGAMAGGFQGGVGKLLGGLLAQKMKQRMQPQGQNPLDMVMSGDPGQGIQPMA